MGHSELANTFENPFISARVGLGNPYDVYLHDTNDRRLFTQSHRFQPRMRAGITCGRTRQAIAKARSELAWSAG